ncbi:MAG: DnrO protein [Dokdonella sp.]
MNRISLILVVLGGMSLAPCTHAEPQHSHDASTKHVAVPAQRWATDAPLREGMARVRTALDELRHYEMGHMPTNMALERVADIEEATRYMFTHCKLAPDADAALHGMLGPLLAGAAALKNNPDGTSAVDAMRRAVADYPRYFDDPARSVPSSPEDVHDDAR